MFLVCYIVFITFIISSMEEYKITSEIGNTGLKKVSLFNYFEIVWDILTFNILSGTENIPIWFSLLISIPIYALIIYLLIDLIPTVD